MDAGGTAPISRSRAMPPATAAAQATTSTPNRSRRRRTPRVAPLMANTKVAPRSIASNSIVSTLHRLQQPAEMAEWAKGEPMAKRSFRHSRVARFVVRPRRLLLAFAAGLLFFAVLPDRLYPPTRFIFAWDESRRRVEPVWQHGEEEQAGGDAIHLRLGCHDGEDESDRKSTRLNSSHT